MKEARVLSTARYAVSPAETWGQGLEERASQRQVRKALRVPAGAACVSPSLQGLSLLAGVPHGRHSASCFLSMQQSQSEQDLGTPPLRCPECGRECAPRAEGSRCHGRGWGPVALSLAFAQCWLGSCEQCSEPAPPGLPGTSGGPDDGLGTFSECPRVSGMLGSLALPVINPRLEFSARGLPRGSPAWCSPRLVRPPGCVKALSWGEPDCLGTCRRCL